VNSTRMHKIAAGACLAAGMFAARWARADVDLGVLAAHLGNVGRTAPVSGQPSLVTGLSPFENPADGLLRLLVRSSDGHTPKGPNLIEVAPGLAALATTPERLTALVKSHPEWHFAWSAPRHLLLDRVLLSVHADVVQRDLGQSGAGVVVGIVDTGVDVRHLDLRNADGTTRIAWLLDLSRPALGLHPDIEKQFGCLDDLDYCAVYSGADIDALIGNDVAGDEPRDSFGHGTHVASLAAGNGLSSPVPRYIGLAPEATLVVVRATRDGGGLLMDSDIVNAVNFVFAMADDLGMPAVANLSLGGDFGAHDGTSEIERGLSDLVGEEHPGRAIVVAAGNSGELYGGLPYPEPLGVHTMVQVPTDSSVRVPMLVGQSVAPDQPSRVFAWIASRPHDRLSVGLDLGQKNLVDPVAIGDDKTVDRSGLTVTIMNGITESDRPETVDHSGAAVIVQGSFASDTVLGLRLEGSGTASIWVQPDGGIDPALGSLGVLLPGAQREGTVTVPASAPDLIAVGATLNRTGWTDIDGVDQSSTLAINWIPVVGDVLTFSSAGPNAIDGMKPDILAPGAYVAGAMSTLADPRRQVGQGKMFDVGSECSEPSSACLVMDDTHALGVGTSMASPVVTGAVALLLQSHPSLTQSQIRRVLQSSADQVAGFIATPCQAGPGTLDVAGALSTLDDTVTLGTDPDPDRSWISLGRAYAAPDSSWPIEATLHVKDAQGRTVDVDPDQLTVEVTQGRVVRAIDRDGPGFYRFAISADDRSGGRELGVRVFANGRELSSRSLTIAVDASVIRGNVAAGRGCASAPQGIGPKSHAWIAVLIGLLLVVRRRRPSAE